MTYVANRVEGFDELAADHGFSGVVRVDRADEVVLERAFGFADRAHGVGNAVDTQIGIASGSKSFTALTVLRLCELGVLGLSTTARSLLGEDLSLIDDAVTIEQLLCHRSGIGDYLDEDEQGDVNEPILDVPVHRLASTDGFLPMLDGHPMVAAPGTQFSYCNGGFMVLALLLERATSRTFHELVGEHVFEPAGMSHTAYLRQDELPGTAAIGYLEPDGLRCNVLHLPVRGNGDGGAYTTAADVRAFWTALGAGRIVSPASVEEATRPRRLDASTPHDYGFGFWLRPAGGVIEMEGNDAGATFRSLHRPSDGLTCTVLSNTTNGAWPITKWLEEQLGL